MEDRISTLPSNIVELILMFLPIADAVRTSILSRRWRYQWCTIPHLVFKQTISISAQYKLEDIVDQALLLHNGPIHKFAFDVYSDLKDRAPVDRWMVFLSRNNVKDLLLRFSSDRLYRLPTALYSCQALVSLELHDCDFQIPRSFNGFSCLTDLSLQNISISDFGLADLISKSPILRKLRLIDFYGCFHLQINAPRLEELVVDGVFADIFLVNTPDLATLCLQLEDEEIDIDDEYFENVASDNKEECGFNMCLSNIPKIERLKLQQNFLDFMTRGRSSVRFPTYNFLKKVSLGCLNLEDLNHVVVLLSLLENTPVLRILEIEADSDSSIATIPISSFSDKALFRTCRLEQLQSVKLTELMGVDSEVEFIEFLLATASALESLTIELDNEARDEITFYKEIMRFRRASTRAEIVILD